MCSLGTKIKPKINSITKQIHPNRANELWSKLKLEHLKFQLDDWLRDSVIEPADSPWALLLVPVKKKNGQVRWAAYFRVLNSLPIDHSFPTPNISEVLETDVFYNFLFFF